MSADLKQTMTAHSDDLGSSHLCFLVHMLMAVKKYARLVTVDVGVEGIEAVVSIIFLVVHMARTVVRYEHFDAGKIFQQVGRFLLFVQEMSTRFVLP